MTLGRFGLGEASDEVIFLESVAPKGLERPFPRALLEAELEGHTLRRVFLLLFGNSGQAGFVLQASLPVPVPVPEGGAALGLHLCRPCLAVSAPGDCREGRSCRVLSPVQPGAGVTPGEDGWVGGEGTVSALLLPLEMTSSCSGFSLHM